MIIQISAITMSCISLVLSIWCLHKTVNQYRRTKEVKKMLNRIYGTKMQNEQIKACKDAYKGGLTHANIYGYTDTDN